MNADERLAEMEERVGRLELRTDGGEYPPTMSVEEAGKYLGISRGLAYEAARQGQIPTIRIGRRLRVPRRRLIAMVEGFDPGA